jgi:peptidoglycan-associated lipoprotein
MADKDRKWIIPPRPCCVNPEHMRKEHDDPNSILFKRSVYFDFDQYRIKEEFRPLVDAHGKYLSSHRDIKVYVIGNTDARGSREYNLALGQKRAESLHTMFSLLGVSENQMEVISFGAERPKAEGDNEAAWAENRRVDIKYDDK